MELYPAIDIRQGRAVRLRQGRFEDQTVYADDPLEAARAWVQAGARRLHVVDLDGARAGHPVALDHVARMARELDVPLQLGGGLRSAEAISAALDAGAARVVVGTAAHTDPALLRSALELHGDRVAVAVDVRDRRVATAAWTQDSDLEPAETVGRLSQVGVATIVYTDIDRDGMLDGPDLGRLLEVAEAMDGGELIYSGGIGELSHLRALSASGAARLAGVIVGKALYEGRFTVAEATTALSDPA